MNLLPNNVRTPSWQYAVVVVFALVLHSEALSFSFVLDDWIHAARDFPGLLSRFQASWGLHATWPGNLFRPVFVASLVGSYSLVGAEPWFFHLTNLVLHALLCVVLLRCLSRLFAQNVAFAIVLLFSVHAIHVEVLGSISYRTELLAALFSMLSIYLATLSTSRLRLLCAGLSFLLALLSKESAVVAPLLYALVCWYQRRVPREAIHSGLVAFLPPLLIAAVLRYLVFGELLVSDAEVSLLDNPIAQLSIGARVGNAMLLLGSYVRLCIVPFPLSADYSYAAVPLTGASEIAVAGVLLVCVGAATVFGFLRNRALAFFGSWFFCSFALTANLLTPIGVAFAERLAYLPSLGIIGLLVTIVSQYPSPRVVQTAFFAYAVFLSGLTVYQLPMWTDDFELTKRSLLAQGKSARLQQNFSVALRERGELEAAEHHAWKALELFPEYTEACFGMSLLRERQGDEVKARFWLERALQLNPHYAPALLAKGRGLHLAGNSVAARPFFLRATKDPAWSTDAWIGLWAVAIEMGDFDEAATIGRRLVRTHPSHPDVIRFAAILEARQKAQNSQSASE